MSDFKATPTTDLTIEQLLDRYQIEDESILQSWAKLHGINGYRRGYSPTEISLIDHVHHHLQVLNMKIEDYQDLIHLCYSPQQSISDQDKNNTMHHQPNSQPSSSPNPAFNSQPAQASMPAEPQQDDSSADQSDQLAQESVEMIAALTEQYSTVVDFIGDRIADHLIEELDVSVMRHLTRKVKERQALTNQTQSNRFLQAIQTVFKAKDNPALPRGGQRF
ncbi:MAG: hypothetical protein HC835_05110 [Oscillatoriales cyanobacterium RM2_1_1]|nr:hypothetical protein [Oscillatoriales cyanobacterium RM2_1_1]